MDLPRHDPHHGETLGTNPDLRPLHTASNLSRLFYKLYHWGKEIGFRAGKLEKLLDFYSHPGYITHKVHLLVACNLEWDRLEIEDGEEILVKTFTLDEALAATREDYRCDPEAALALWLYAGNIPNLR